MSTERDGEVVATLTLGLTSDEFSVLVRALARAYGPHLYVRAGNDPATVSIVRPIEKGNA